MQSFWDLLPASLWPTPPFISPDQQARTLHALWALQAPANAFSPLVGGSGSLAGAASSQAPDPTRSASGGDDASAPGGILGAIFGASAAAPTATRLQDLIPPSRQGPSSVPVASTADQIAPRLAALIINGPAWGPITAPRNSWSQVAAPSGPMMNGAMPRLGATAGASSTVTEAPAPRDSLAVAPHGDDDNGPTVGVGGVGSVPAPYFPPQNFVQHMISGTIEPGGGPSIKPATFADYTNLPIVGPVIGVGGFIADKMRQNAQWVHDHPIDSSQPGWAREPRPGERYARPGGGQNIGPSAETVANMAMGPFYALHEMMHPPPLPPLPPNAEMDETGRVHLWQNGKVVPWESVDPAAAKVFYDELNRRADAVPSFALKMLTPGTAFRAAPAGSIGVGAGAARPPVSAAEANLIRNWLPIEPGQFRGTVRLDPPALSGELLDESGARMGSVDREIDPASKTAYHRDLQLSQANQGRGFSKDMMRSSVDFYRQQGLNTVNVLADDIGAYVWAKHGFVPDQVSWDELRRSLARRIGNPDTHIPPGVRQDVLRLLLDPDPRAIWRVSDMRVPALTASGEPVLTSLGQPMTLGQRLLLGQRWNGTFNLQDEATMRRFGEYVRRR